MMSFRADSIIRASIVRWAENQPDTPSLSEAISRLVEIGLAAKAPRPQSASTNAGRRAKELAAHAIDKLTPKNVAADEVVNRKRHLIKGPEEFHDVRLDRVKK